MNERYLRPIGTTYETFEDTDRERIVTTWQIVGYVRQFGRLVENAKPLYITRQPKVLIGGTERKLT